MDWTPKRLSQVTLTSGYTSFVAAFFCGWAALNHIENGRLDAAVIFVLLGFLCMFMGGLMLGRNRAAYMMQEFVRDSEILATLTEQVTNRRVQLFIEGGEIAKEEMLIRLRNDGVYTKDELYLLFGD